MKKLILLLLVFAAFKVSAQQTFWMPGIMPGSSSFSPTFRFIGTDSSALFSMANGNRSSLLYTASQQNLRFLKKIDSISGYITPTYGNTHYIKNQDTVQANTNFYISSKGTMNALAVVDPPRKTTPVYDPSANNGTGILTQAVNYAGAVGDHNVYVMGVNYLSDYINKRVAINPNLFTGSDHYRIQQAVDSAARSTGIVEIPSINNNTGAKVWLLDSAVLLRSNVTINIIDTKIKRTDSNRDNFFRTDNSGFGITTILPDSNIYINGIGKVILEGADNPRATGVGKLLYSSGVSTGKSYGTDAGVGGQEQMGDWRNNGIEIAVTHNFGVSNLTFVNQQGHTVKIERSHSGYVNNIIFHDPASRVIGGVSVSTLNPDGVNMYADCYGITVNGISGLTGDDMVAIGVLDSATTPHGPGEYGGSPVVTGTGYVTGQDMRYIHISNVTGHGVGLTRLINTANAKIHDIILESIIDTSSVSQVGGYIVKIGDPSGTYGPQAPIANCYNITINNIKDLNSQFCLYIGGGVDKSYFTNIRKAQTGPSAAITFQALAFGCGPQVITDNIVYENTPLTTLAGRTVRSTLKQGIDINADNLMLVNDAVSHRGLQYATHYNFAGLPQSIIDKQYVDSVTSKSDTGFVKQTTTHSFTSATNIENLQLGTTVPANCYLGIRITASNYSASNTYAGLLVKTYHVTIASSAITGTSNATETALSSMASLVNIGTPTLVGGVLTFPIMANSASTRMLCFKVEIFGAPTLIPSFLPLTWGTPGTGSFAGSSVAGVPGGFNVGGTIQANQALLTAVAAGTAGTDSLLVKSSSTNVVRKISPATYLTPTGSAASLTGFPTFNQNTTGSAAKLATGRTLSITGDVTYTSPSFDGSANVTAAGTVAQINGITKSFYDPTSSIQTQLNARVDVSTTQTIGGTKTATGLWQFNNFLSGSSNIGSSAGFSFSPYINKSGTGLFGIGQNYSNGDSELDLISFLPNPTGSPAAIGGLKFLNVSAGGTVTNLLDINGSNFTVGVKGSFYQLGTGSTLGLSSSPWDNAYINSSAYSTGGNNILALNSTTKRLETITALPNGTTATTQSIADISPKVATGAYVAAYVAANTFTPTGLFTPRIVGRDEISNATNAQTLTSYTVGAGAGSFDISANILVTASTLHNFNVLCTYTDEGGTSRVLTLNVSQLTGAFITAITNGTGTGAYEGVPVHIRAQGGTTITISTSGTFTGVTYTIEGIIEQIY